MTAEPPLPAGCSSGTAVSQAPGCTAARPLGHCPVSTSVQVHGTYAAPATARGSSPPGRSAGSRGTCRDGAVGRWVALADGDAGAKAQRAACRGRAPPHATLMGRERALKRSGRTAGRQPLPMPAGEHSRQHGWRCASVRSLVAVDGYPVAHGPRPDARARAPADRLAGGVLHQRAAGVVARRRRQRCATDGGRPKLRPSSVARRCRLPRLCRGQGLRKLRQSSPVVQEAVVVQYGAHRRVRLEVRCAPADDGGRRDAAGRHRSTAAQYLFAHLRKSHRGQ